MRGAIKYKRKEIILISIVFGLYIITFLYLANEYLSNPSALLHCIKKSIEYLGLKNNFFINIIFNLI